MQPRFCPGLSGFGYVCTGLEQGLGLVLYAPLVADCVTYLMPVFLGLCFPKCELMPQLFPVMFPVTPKYAQNALVGDRSRGTDLQLEWLCELV